MQMLIHLLNRSGEGPARSTSTHATPAPVTPSKAVPPQINNHFAIALQKLQSRWELQSEIWFVTRM